MTKDVSAAADLASSKMMEVADGNQDGHIHLFDDIPNKLAGLLESEFIEDYFYRENAGRDELSRHTRHIQADFLAACEKLGGFRQMCLRPSGGLQALLTASV